MSEITVQSMVSHRTRKPMVSIYWPKDVEAAQLTPDEARAFALSILVSAEAAEQDAFMMAFASKKIGLQDAEAAQFLNGYREWRTESPATAGGD